MDLGKGITVAPGTTLNICLNGHSITRAGGRIFTINGGTLTTYVGDEVIQDLTDYIPDNAPLYQIRRTGDAAITRDTMTDEGRLVAFYNIKQTVQGSWAGPWARADWLAEYGAEGSDLVTYDDWLNFLVWAKDAHSDTLLTPYGFNAQGLDRYLLTGYGLSNNWIVENGEVKHSVLQPAFKDYLNMCIDWYSKGAISDFVFSGDRLTFDNYAEGACAMAMTYTNWWDTIYNYAAQKDNNEGFDIVAIGIPKLNPDDIRRIEHGTCPTTPCCASGSTSSTLTKPPASATLALRARATPSTRMAAPSSPTRFSSRPRAMAT